MALDKGSLNKVMLIGRLGADPEIRYTNSNVPVANLSIATSTTYRDKDGNNQENTEWHRVAAFNKIAEVAENYLGKGKLVYVEGRLQTRQYEDKEGNTRYSTEVLAYSMNMLGGKGDGSSSAGDNSAQQQSAPEPQAQAKAGGSAPEPGADEVDDDLPF